jgi:hypothetical protein
MVQAMMLFEGYLPPVTGPAVILARPRVNGIGVEPSGGNVTHFSMTQQCPPNVTFCTVTGIFWLDLDAAEDAHKGMFLGSLWTSLCWPRLATVAEASLLMQR